MDVPAVSGNDFGGFSPQADPVYDSATAGYMDVSATATAGFVDLNPEDEEDV